jgi:hypothetical protein
MIAAGGLLVLIVVAFLAWLGLTAPEEVPRPAAQPASSPTSLVTLPPLAPAAQPTATAAPATVPPVPTATAAGGAQRVDVELRTVDRSWIRATVDGRIVYEDTMNAGQTQRWIGQQSVALRVGNAGGVDVTLNGQRVGALGPVGQPADREFSR